MTAPLGASLGAPLAMSNPQKHQGDDQGADGAVEVLTKTRVKRPPLYRVVMLNDDYTTQEFVVLVLRRYFHKTNEEAQQLMRAIHNTGKGVAGVYPHDIAVTKIQQVRAAAQQHSMPLRLTLEADR